MNAKKSNRKCTTYSFRMMYRLHQKRTFWLIIVAIGMAFCFVLRGSGEASQYKAILNTFTGRFDFVNDLSTGNVVNASSFRTIDSNSCLLDISISTPGMGDYEVRLERLRPSDSKLNTIKQDVIPQGHVHFPLT